MGDGIFLFFSKEELHVGFVEYVLKHFCIGATTECRATLDQNLLKNEAEHNRHYCDSIRCK